MRRAPRVSPSRRVSSPSAQIASGQRARVEPLEGRQLLAADLISVNLAGTGTGNGESTESSVSGDGRFVAFVSTSTDLVAGDTNGKPDVFLRDRLNNTTRLISKNTTSGGPGDDSSSEPKISNDGAFVVFATRASNLIPGDTVTGAGGNQDVVRYNVSSGTLELVSARPVGGFAGAASGQPSISADGRWVAFQSFAGNIGAADSNAANDVYLRDMSRTGVGSTVLVSTAIGGNETATPGNQESFDPQVSDDGRFVSFRSRATNLVANDTNGLLDTFVRNVQSGVTTLVSVTTAGGSGNAESESNSISGDGKFVAFRSLASDLTPNDTNNTQDIFLRNLETNTTTLLSSNRTGTASARGQSRFPWLSADGGAATFSSDANDLIDGDNNNLEDVFLRDLRNGPIYLISTNRDGNAGGNGASFDPYVSRDGKFITFSSEASDLTTIADGNARADIYLQVAPNNPGDPADPDPDPTPGPGPTPNPTPTPTPSPTPSPTPTPTPTVPPDPNPGQPDMTPPIASLPATQPAPTQGSLEYLFNVSLLDERALNTIAFGNLTVTKAGGAPLTATFVSVVGSGTSATATYRVAFANPLSPADNGPYTVDLPANSIKDAAGNSAAAATIGAFTLDVGSPTDPDLTVAVTAKLPSTPVIIGAKARGTAKVSITNAGQTAITKQNVPVTLYLSDNPTRDAADIALATQTKALSLKTGKGKSLSFKYTYPATAGNGSYFLIAEADTGNVVREANESNNIAVSGTAVTLQQPFVDLRATVTPPGGVRSPGGSVTSAVTVINDGNVALARNVTITLAASTDAAADPSDAVLTTITKKVSVKAGASGKPVLIKFNLPATLPAGTYFVTATLDPLGEIIERSKSNNTAVTAQSIAIA